MLDIYYSAKFKRDLKRIKKQGRDIERLKKIVNMLAYEQPLPPQYRDHALTGYYIGQRECHIQPDWLLIYQIKKDKLVLSLTRTGSHSELLEK